MPAACRATVDERHLHYGDVIRPCPIDDPMRWRLRLRRRDGRIMSVSVEQRVDPCRGRPQFLAEHFMLLLQKVGDGHLVGEADPSGPETCHTFFVKNLRPRIAWSLRSDLT